MNIDIINIFLYRCKLDAPWQYKREVMKDAQSQKGVQCIERRDMNIDIINIFLYRCNVDAPWEHTREVIKAAQSY